MKIIRSKTAVEAGPQDAAPGARHVWNVLVVDDEADVRTLTKLNLKGFTFDGRELRFLEAASAAEGRALLAEHDDIALALIDVVMETDDAGLRLVEHIRKDLGNGMMRLVIRTGQPGVAPERYVIDHFDIDDYKDKTELTATRLYTTVRSAIKAYRDLKTIDFNRLGLARVLNAAPGLYSVSESSLTRFFEGVLMQVVGLCNLAEIGMVSSIEGLVATMDGRDLTVHATIGSVDDAGRVEEIRQLCIEAVHRGSLPERIRQNGIVIPLRTRRDPVGFVYVEPMRGLSAADMDLLQVMAQQCASALENLRLHIDLKASYENAINMLAEIAEFKDKTTGQHIQRIEAYTRLVAIEMGQSEEDAVLWGKASRLHDVGKIGIPDHILRKQGRLTAEEFEVMKTHVNIGASILSHDKSLALAREVALSHHERWDGTGYPTGCSSREVSLLTRIVSVVDVFDALMSRRPYKAPWLLNDAEANIEAAAGSQFDPDVVAAFLRLLRRGALADLINSVLADNDMPLETLS
jgi:response regulator RpfG family c-di-GMP phosphodiesterase